MINCAAKSIRCRVCIMKLKRGAFFHSKTVMTQSVSGTSRPTELQETTEKPFIRMTSEEFALALFKIMPDFKPVYIRS